MSFRIYFYFEIAGSNATEESYFPNDAKRCFLIHLNEATGKLKPGAISKSPLYNTTGFVSFVLNLLYNYIAISVVNI